MQKTHKLIIIGDSAFAEIAHEYFTYDSYYEVVAFSVEKNYLKRNELFRLPVSPFETLEEIYSPKEHHFFAANVYTQLNRLRTRLYNQAKQKGYSPASYISPHAFIWRNCEVGEHCFIFENNVVQPFAKIGDNVILWSGNHIGHHSVIKDNCFISSHVVVSGFVEVGENSFLGVNAAIANNIKIGRDCWLGPNATVVKNIPDGAFVKPPRAEMGRVSTVEYFKIAD